MRRVNIQNISNKTVKSVFSWQNAYGVWLDWGVTVRFSNKKEANRFKAYVNEKLTEYSFELNNVFTGLFVEFRRVYFNLLLASEKEALWRSFSDCERLFNRITEKSEKHGYAFSVVRDIDALAASLVYLCEYFNDWHKKKQRYNEARQMAGFAGRCNAVKLALKDLPEKFNY